MQKAWPRPLPAPAGSGARRRGLPARSAPRPRRAGGSEPTSPPAAERRGALGRASRLRPAHAARLHFYGERTIAEVWRVAVCRRDNRGFLFIATLSTCRRVGWVGPRRAWGSRGCPAREGRATCRSCSPRCSSPARRPCTRGPFECNSVLPPLPPHPVLSPAAQSTRCARPGGSCPPELENAARSPFPGAPSTGCLEKLGTPPPPLALASRVLASGPAVTERPWRVR